MIRAMCVFLILLIFAHPIRAQGKKIDWHCPEIAIYKDHWKRNKTNGLYYFNATVADMQKYQRTPPKTGDYRCTQDLDPKQVRRILGKPSAIKENFNGKYLLYAYYVDSTYSAIQQDWELLYIFFSNDTHLTKYGFDRQQDIDKLRRKEDGDKNIIPVH